jgi:hypothetical protein
MLSDEGHSLSFVIAGLDPAIHPKMDPRIIPGLDPGTGGDEGEVGDLGGKPLKNE